MSDRERELAAIYTAASRAYFGGEENPAGEEVDDLIAVMEAHAEDHEEDAEGDEPKDSFAQAALLRLAASLLRSSQKEELGVPTRSFFAVEAVLVIHRYQAID